MVAIVVVARMAAAVKVTEKVRRMLIATGLLIKSRLLNRNSQVPFGLNLLCMPGQGDTAQA